MPTLVIVTGPPAAGKTTLSRRLAADLRLPLLTKDGFKETLFDSLGYGETEWSRRLGAASFDLLFHAAGSVLAGDADCVIEANFDVDRSLPSFLHLQGRHPFHPIQVVCRTRPETFVARYAERHESGRRHPGHHTEMLRDPEQLLQRHGPLALDGAVFMVDNETWEAQEYPVLLERLRHQFKALH